MNGKIQITPQAGLRVFMPDIDKIPADATNRAISLQWLKNRPAATARCGAVIHFAALTGVRGGITSIMILLAAGPDGRCRLVNTGFGQVAQAGRGKSELHRAVCRITSGRQPVRAVDGKCHREDTAAVDLSDAVRVKRCGKSAPRRR